MSERYIPGTIEKMEEIKSEALKRTLFSLRNIFLLYIGLSLIYAIFTWITDFKKTVTEMGRTHILPLLSIAETIFFLAILVLFYKIIKGVYLQRKREVHAELIKKAQDLEYTKKKKYKLVETYSEKDYSVKQLVEIYKSNLKEIRKGKKPNIYIEFLSQNLDSEKIHFRNEEQFAEVRIYEIEK